LDLAVFDERKQAKQNKNNQLQHGMKALKAFFFLPCFRIFDGIFLTPFRLFEADPYGCMAGQNGGSVS